VDLATAAAIYALLTQPIDVSYFGGPPDPPRLHAMADGGRPYPSEPVLVAEEGPELFVPDQPGTVVPQYFMPPMPPQDKDGAGSLRPRF
jgi:hypothetical protein